MPDSHGRRLSVFGVLWALPCSLVGLTLGVFILLGGGSVRWAGCAIEFAPYRNECPSGSRFRRLPFSAITFGHVILGLSLHDLARLRAHELVHVRQYERLGPLFFIAYPASSLLAIARSQCPYRGNQFEIEAFAEAAALQIEPAAHPVHELDSSG